MFWLLGGVSCWVNRSVVGDCVQDVGDGVPCLTAVAKEIALRVHDGGIPSLDPHAYEHVADKSQLL